MTVHNKKTTRNKQNSRGWTAISKRLQVLHFFSSFSQTNNSARTYWSVCMNRYRHILLCKLDRQTLEPTGAPATFPCRSRFKNGVREVIISDVKWSEGIWSVMIIRLKVEGSENGEWWKMVSEVKWSEVKWSEVKWSEGVWSVIIIRLKVVGSENGEWWKMVSEVKWSEGIWSVMIIRLKVEGSENGEWWKTVSEVKGFEAWW